MLTPKQRSKRLDYDSAMFSYCVYYMISCKHPKDWRRAHRRVFFSRLWRLIKCTTAFFFWV